MTTNTTRRGILVGLPAAAVVAPVAAAAQPDPIFALIAEYKRTTQEHCELCEPYEEAEWAALKASGHPQGSWYEWSQEDPAGYEACRRSGVPADLAERWRANREACHDVIHGLESTVPTTLAGAAALLTFWIHDNPLEDGTSDWHAPVLNNVLTALERLAC